MAAVECFYYKSDNKETVMPKTYDAAALIEELELDQEDIVELLTDFREFLLETLPQLEAAINA